MSEFINFELPKEIDEKMRDAARRMFPTSVHKKYGYFAGFRAGYSWQQARIIELENKLLILANMELDKRRLKDEIKT
jgi:hypothetical protein